MPQLSCHQERVFKLQKVSNLASSLVVLLSGLPPSLRYKWLSCGEINELLTFDLECLRASCFHATKLGHLECRKFLKPCVRFYRLQRMESSSSTLQEERGASNWSLPTLPSNYFTSEIFLGHVKAVDDFVSFNATRKRKASSEVQVTTPARKKRNSTAPTVTPSPKKSKTSPQQPPCRGWRAEKLYDIFQLSFQDCRQCTGMEVKTPTEIGLSEIYKNFKDFTNLAFFCEESAVVNNKSADDNKTCYVLRSRQCLRSLAPGTKATGLCASCGP
jgi:hypothetical protein